MKRIPVTEEIIGLPEVFRPWLAGAPIYDSSCSQEARVLYLDRDGGFFLKSAPKGSLAAEAALDQYFYSKRLGPEVLEYLSADSDWLLTQRIPGEDCTHPDYLSDPKRLCDVTAELLRQLHETDFQGCPVPNRMEGYFAAAEANRAAGRWDMELFSGPWSFSSPEEAWAAAQAGRPYLKCDTLLHGDYCLPNILLDSWRFSGFIDLGTGGVGDRHIDLFWGLWSLFFNLKTNRYTDRFLDAYGRDEVQPELLRAIAAFEIFG